MKPITNKIRKILAVTLLAAFAATAVFLPETAFAEETFTDDYGNYVEWWNFRNTETNNAVTERPTPTSDQEAWEKWSSRYGTGWSASPTPPVIVNKKLYIGVGKKVVEVDKETGEALRESEEMPGSVGYAMQSPVYADGKIFVAITNGRICAINLSDMSLAWTTDNSEIIKGQTVSPISYKRINGTGYVYTGTWTKNGGDLICATTNDSNVFTDENGKKIKKLVWHFNPQEEDAQNLEENNCVALGYYWTGAYVTDRYLAIGADNGSTLGDYVNDTAFYTLNPLTGEIIDVVYGIKGMVRSTAVYVNGYLYFSTKGAKIYKIPVDEDGKLGEASYIDLEEFGASAATATPVVYGGKIYLGVQGKGGEFSADGGHGFLVVKDDPVLSQESFIYNIPVPGYPQAGALLSDYHVDEDFDGDNKADGRVYLFFTYNAPPGGLFYTYDTPDQTVPTSLTVEESKIFIPAEGKQQYCISSIVVDSDGVLYYKNDSGYVFAVESNPAALLDLQLQDEQGNRLALNQEFHAKTAEYTGFVPNGTEKVRIVLSLEDGTAATVNGTAYSGGGTLISLPEDETSVSIVTSRNGKNRMYSLTVVKKSADATLRSLASTIGNTAPNLSTAIVREITPELSTEVDAYEFDWITTGTGDASDPASNSLMNVFLAPSAERAIVRVYPVENVDEDKLKQLDKLEPDGAIKGADISNNKDYTKRFPVYAKSPTHDSKVRVVVTAGDGITTKEYTLKFNRRVYVSDVTLKQKEEKLTAGETLQLSADVLPENATDKTFSWSSSDESVAKVDDDGLVTAVGGGEAVITASSEDGPSDTCKVTVSCAVTLHSGTGYTVEAAEGSSSPVVSGGDYQFRVTIAEDYKKGQNFAVKANETVLEADENGVYTIRDIKTNQEVTVEDVVTADTVFYWNVALPESQAGYSAAAEEGSESPVEEGKSYRFKVNIAEGYTKGADFAVKANGTVLEADENGVYTISNITAHQTVTVEGVQKLRTDLSTARVEAGNLTYSGKAKVPAVKVTLNGKTLVLNSDYSASCKDVKVGKATVVITGIGQYKGTVKKAFTIRKAANTMKVRAKKTLSVKAGKKKVFAAKKVFSVTKPVGGVTYAKVKGNAKISIDRKTGKITVNKGLKKGKTYKVTFAVKAAGNKNVKAGTKKVTIVFRIN